MAFADNVRRWTVTVPKTAQSVFANVASETLASIRDGSATTGSPGQPVDTGALKASWQLELESETSALISTNMVYAPSIEDGVSYAHAGMPMMLRSQVGGFHSVKLTIAGFDKIVAAEAAKVAA